ncbi:ESX secretion-associated protein EspG [Nocardia sp. NEAU-G5]|uniref:ESX secretion-associated protein EspG n=1 Tax=Nocardia albiluteola TaxID=2842303 RepID=A0ABS6B5A7_9NOCA|nr:ESX secretion-associated protein EspG [Nocardia albiluteola]MBU3064921.1 ESX secretion-associated protein EspG [Nocardia albiluteola]
MTTLSPDMLTIAADLLEIPTLPVVLALDPQHETIAAAQAAYEAGLGTLRGHGLVDEYGGVTSDVASALYTLAQPERQLVARSFGPTGIRRMCLARRGGAHALAVREDDTVDIREIWCDEDPANLARIVSGVLGRMPAAEIPVMCGPAVDIAERFDAAMGSADFADVAYHFGVTGQEAVHFGLAMSACHTHTEIVCYGEDAATVVGAVAVYDTDRGRIVAAPDSPPGDPRTWTTLTSGSDHRLAQAISNLIEALPGGRWMP